MADSDQAAPAPAMVAAEVPQRMGKPVRLPWSRTDDFRQGRAYPIRMSRERAIVLGNVVVPTIPPRSVATGRGRFDNDAGLASSNIAQ